MITASHNPAQYNGMKFTRSQAQAISLDTGLATIRDQLLSGELPPKAAMPREASRSATSSTTSPQHCLSFVDRAKIKPFQDRRRRGQRDGGRDDSRTFSSRLPCEVVPLYFELDGSFPNHPASPIEPENMVDLQAEVRKHDATSASLSTATPTACSSWMRRAT